MGTEHRVASHLGVAADSYDVAIRRWIPGYDTMVQTIIEMLGQLATPTPTIVDLGTGTGALAAAILDALPAARVIMIDIDPSMLEQARARVAAHADAAAPAPADSPSSGRARAELRRASFDDALPACDAVVASLALHHVPDLTAKRALYARIHAALRPGGVFLMGDATAHARGPEHAHTYRQWAAGMAAAGIATADAHALFAQWAREDFYQPLHAELAALAAAGFPHPDCFWKQGAITVYGGFK